MSQPPYPPRGGDEETGFTGRDEPTQEFGVPGESQRNQTQQFAQTPYGQQWAPPGEPPRRGNKSTSIALIVAGVVVLAAIALALVVLVRNGSSYVAGSATAASSSTDSSSSSGDGIPPATVPPDGLGDDPTLDDYAQGCFNGDMTACDDLVDQSDPASDYETYGDTCAGRQPAGTDVSCTDAFPA